MASMEKPPLYMSGHCITILFQVGTLRRSKQFLAISHPKNSGTIKGPGTGQRRRNCDKTKHQQFSVTLADLKCAIIYEKKCPLTLL